jgi:eukaryotic-like serine/threonine-protein kinase
VLARAKRLPAQRTCEIALQLCDALAVAHERDIVHRDLKPENVVLTDAPDDVVKVLDFGLAKSLAREATANSGITQAGTVIGTPLYMAPEAITGDAPDPRSDLYALGCLLFEMLLGAPPYVAESINVILARHLHEPVPPLPNDVPPALRDLVTALLAKEPAERPQTARIVHAHLAAILATLTPEDEAPTLIHTPRVARGTAPPPVPLPPLPATLPSQPPPPVRATIRALPPPPPAATQMVPAQGRRWWPVIVMSIVVAIAVFVAVVIALGP